MRDDVHGVDMVKAGQDFGNLVNPILLGIQNKDVQLAARLLLRL